MPLFKYKAVNKQGQIVDNKVDATNQYILIKKLKKNDLLPIEVIVLGMSIQVRFVQAINAFAGIACALVNKPNSSNV